MPVSFDASEVRKLSADIDRGKERVGRDVSVAVKAAAERVKAAGQSNAPKLTGTLAASIGIDMYGDGRSVGLTAVVGPTARYGLFVENGTSKMAAQPFMGPALESEGPRFADELGKAVEGVLG